jgi:hypothetical protein
LSRAASTSATQASFTDGCVAIPSSVAQAIPPPPKLASRNCDDRGFEKRFGKKSGAAKALRKRLRRLVGNIILYPNWQHTAAANVMLAAL